MKTLYIIHGLKRSGNHAILNWILAQKKMPFYNNIIPISPILSGKKTMPLPVNFDDWLKNKENSLKKKITLSYSKCFMVSLEDHAIDVKPFVDGKYKVVNIIILRDPRNLFSSRIRKASFVNLAAYPMENGPIMKRAVDLWIEHAKEFTCETSFLCNKICIYFNEWFSNPIYRKEISSQLGFKFTDKGFRKISSEGGGSSFDQTKFDGNNQKLNVLDRKSMLSDSEQTILDQVLNRAELKILMTKLDILFGNPTENSYRSQVLNFKKENQN